MDMLTRGFGRLRDGCGVIAGICAFLMMASVVPDVIGRWLFSQPIQGTLEFNELLMVGIVFFGLAWTQFEKGHVRVTLLTEHLPPRVQAGLNALVWLLGLLLYLAIGLWGAAEAYSSVLIGETKWGVIRFPVWPARVVIALGCLMLCVQLVIDIVAELRVLSGARQPDAQPLAATPALEEV